jgi:hypothetical protein
LERSPDSVEERETISREREVSVEVWRAAEAHV